MVSDFFFEELGKRNPGITTRLFLYDRVEGNYELDVFFKNYDKIKINYLYVEHNKINSKVVTKEDIEKTQDFIIKTTDIILQDKTFRRTGGKHCNWCQFCEKCDEILDDMYLEDF